MDNVLEYLELNTNRFPDKKAVAFKDEHYTFSELRSVSKRIGAMISKAGKKNSPIAVISDRSIDTIAFFMGVLYSGNFYVPIDPDIPDYKLAAIFKDASIDVVLGFKEAREKVEKIGYDGHYFELSDIPLDEVEMPIINSSDPLYMIYTSGSTGEPKGVLKSHFAEINYIEAFCRDFNLASNEVIGNQTPFYFDASGKDIYLMLKQGYTMEILPTQLFAMPLELIEYLNSKKVTYACWVPTAISIVAQLSPFTELLPETLKYLFFVGEVMPMKHLNVWREFLPNIQYVNLYGQTELSGVCCYYNVEKQFSNDEILPIGKPLSNCELILIESDSIIKKEDADHIGEIYIVSDSLATSYWNDEAKTTASFVSIKVDGTKKRAFKTGDLASYDKDGNLIFASRKDHQIKHSGHRIELGEIETVANSLECINRSCCVYNYEKKAIVLFVTLSSEEVLSDRDIKKLLRDKLVSYMLPKKVIILETMPYNKNGKIDRNSLKDLI